MVTTLKLMPTSPWCGEGGTSLGGVRDVSGTPVSDESGTICQAVSGHHTLIMSWMFATCLRASRSSDAKRREEVVGVAETERKLMAAGRCKSGPGRRQGPR